MHKVTAMRADAGGDWHFEQVRSKRLREILHNPNLTGDERAIAESQLENYVITSRAK